MQCKVAGAAGTLQVWDEHAAAAGCQLGNWQQSVECSVAGPKRVNPLALDSSCCTEIASLPLDPVLLLQEACELQRGPLKAFPSNLAHQN